ncbi:MAG TPA: gamma-glutamyl-gamma-aminobutyrate hydrolase family protein [Bacteroidia bacterium]|nr:gamma-glutamyl-gamma-aminobutyrate hydrolase family protein [Bacteroidia bacterium]
MGLETEMFQVFCLFRSMRNDTISTVQKKSTCTVIIIIDFGSKKTTAIAEMVADCGVENKTVAWQETSEAELTSCGAIIFSGSPTMFTETDHAPYHQKFGFIRQGKIPVLGICFGHQLMGILHGGKIFRGKEVKKEVEIRVMKQDPLFRDLSSRTIMRQDHTEGITLPAGFLHLATSDTYTIEGMRHPMLPLWGVQFHPEVSGENGKILIDNFLREAKAA